MKLSPRKIKRTNIETLAALKDQIKLLRLNCSIYDSGNEIIGKQISTIIRILFHESKYSKSLLKQIGIRDISWLNTSHGLHLDNQISECSLLTMKITGLYGKYMPKCHTDYSMDEYNYKLFPEWWNMPVILDEKQQIFTRRDIVLYVANTDGGAHVDETLDEKYKDILKNNYLGWKYDLKGENKEFEGKIELICMRQMAFEIINTINMKYSELIIQ